MNQALPWQQAHVLPPPAPRKTFFERLHTANAAWQSIMESVRSDGHKRSPLAGGKYVLLIQNFADKLVDDHALRERIVQHLEQRLRDESPKEPGRFA